MTRLNCIIANLDLEQICRGINSFLIFAPNIDCGYSLEGEAVLTCTHNLCFEQK